MPVFDTQLVWLTNQYFPNITDNTGADAQEWTDLRIPVTEDEPLIARMLESRASARAAFGGKATFRQLWNADERALHRSFPDQYQGRPYDASSADAALCQHLAFWTGKDCERMRRLMWQSKLVREKWQREDYLPRTILKACANQKETLAILPVVEPDKPVTAEIGDHPASTFLTPTEQRIWFNDCIYVIAANRVMMPGGHMLDQQRFDVVYGGRTFSMDAANFKTAKSPWDAFTHSQALKFPRVDDVCFRPEIEPGKVINEAGGSLVNIYYPIVTPCEKGDVTPYLIHMGKLFPNAEDRALVDNYLAALAQFPGDKFQWWPLFQGVQGNGKSLILACLEAAIGARYCHRPNAAELTGNGSKFTAWIRGRILIGIEEIKVSDKADLIEVMKPIITNDRLEIQAKGENQVTGDNRANGLLFTNHRDAVPKRNDDRRYAIFYTPQQTVDDLRRDGMDGDYFPNLYAWLRGGGYARVTHYLKSFAIDKALSPAVHNGGRLHRAPVTSSTARAIEVSRGRIEQEILEAIEAGEPGFCGGWVSSVMLSRLMSQTSGKYVLSPFKQRELLESLGYMHHPALPNGRTNNAIMPDGKRPILYLTKGHLALNINDPKRIAQLYTAAQPGSFGQATAANDAPAPPVPFQK